MIVRFSLMLGTLAALAVSIAAPARAAGSSAFELGIGQFIPTSPASSVENFATVPGTSFSQHGNFSVDLSFGRGVIPGGYEITTMLLSQKQTGTFATPFGSLSANETFTQVPLLIENGGTQLGPIRLGAGLGYDWVSRSSFSNASSANGVVGDTFLEVGVGSGAALEARYLFGPRAALSGVYVGIKTHL